MRNKETIHVFLTLFVGVLFILGFSHIGAITFEDYGKNVFKEGTIIGRVDVSGVSRNEAKDLLLNEFTVWKNSSTISILVMEEEIILSSDSFTPNFTATVTQASNGRTSSLIVEMNEDKYNTFLQQLPESLQISDTDLAKLKKDLLEIPSTMQSGDFTLNIFDYVSSKAAVSIIAEETMQVNKEQVADLQEELGLSFTLQIGASSQVSLLDEFSVLSEENLNIVGSVLYKAILSTNFHILERHISKQAPEQIELGYETKIKRDGLDFIFYNPNSSDYIAQFKMNDSTLTVQLKGTTLLNEYNVELSKKSFDPKSIVQIDPKLSLGTVRMIEKGKKGYLIEVIRTKKSKNGEIIDTEFIAEDFYPPVHQVIQSSIIPKEDPLEETDETIEDTIDQEDDIDLDANEEEE